MSDDPVVDLDSRRKKTASVALMEMPPVERPDGPFTVTISNPQGVMFEVTFPDASGMLSPEACVVGTAGLSWLVVNLLAATIKVYAGSID